MALAALLHRYDAGKVTIDSRTVLVLDEASLVGMKDQDRLTEIVAQTGARWSRSATGPRPRRVRESLPVGVALAVASFIHYSLRVSNPAGLAER